MISAVQQTNEAFYAWWARHHVMLFEVSLSAGPRAVAELAFTAGAAAFAELVKQAMAELNEPEQPADAGESTSEKVCGPAWMLAWTLHKLDGAQ
jgi:hypothetical protein